jgi:hypothetical protein
MLLSKNKRIICIVLFLPLNVMNGAHGRMVREALYYGPEGLGFETRLGNCILSIYLGDTP